MIDVARVTDAALKGLVVPSFTRVGIEARRRLFHWSGSDTDLTGRTIAVTGVTSGLGRAAATQLAGRGATVIAIGRDRDRTQRVAADIRDATGNGEVSATIADLGDLDQVRQAATEIVRHHDALDALVHNAGALLHRRTESPSGLEATIASQVVGPFLLTSLLLEPLSAGTPGRVVTVSSGGMYTAPLTVSGLEMGPADYDGTRQYALAKRAQVTLNEMWAQRVDPGSVVFHAMHPGWADTPGVATALPTFRRIVGPLLRDADEGADTMIWLAADDGEPLASTGDFWLDRRRRPIHRLPTTRRSDTQARRDELWSWVSARAGAPTVPSLRGQP